MTESNVLPADYFDKYSGDVKYGDHWNTGILTPWDMVKSLEVVFAINGLRDDADTWVESVLDVGAANGDMMRLFETNFHAEVYGVENAPWAEANVLPEYKDRIEFADWFAVADNFPDDSYDLVIDCIAIYVNPEQLEECIRQTTRVARKAVIMTVVYAEDAEWHDKEYPDPWRKSTLTRQQWLDICKPYCKFVDIHKSVLVLGV